MPDFDYVAAVAMPVIAPPSNGEIPADYYAQLGLTVTVSHPNQTNKSISITVESSNSTPPDTRLFAPIGGTLSYIPAGMPTPLANSFIAPPGGALRLHVWLLDVINLSKHAPVVARDIFFTGIDQTQTELALKVLLLHLSVDQLRALWTTHHAAPPPQTMLFGTLSTDCMNLLMGGHISFFVKSSAVIGRLPLTVVQAKINTSVTIVANKLTGEFISPIRLIRSLPWFDQSMPKHMSDHPLYVAVRKSAVIDPGHGGAGAVGGSSANNASGTTSGAVVIFEKDMTLQVGLRCREVLVRYGFNVVMTRDTDVNLGLTARATVAEVIQSPVFLAIHFNGNDGITQGTETFCHTTHRSISEDLCRTIQSNMVAATGYDDRNSGFAGGVKTQGLGVLVQTSHYVGTACCLTEISFMDVTAEADRLVTVAYINRLGSALANSIEQYISGWDD
jgi:N-acetylmuramoyl-L-alanine amidase